MGNDLSRFLKLGQLVKIGRVGILHTRAFTKRMCASRSFHVNNLLRVYITYTAAFFPHTEEHKATRYGRNVRTAYHSITACFCVGSV
jgi:hypothetical protein